MLEDSRPQLVVSFPEREHIYPSKILQVNVFAIAGPRRFSLKEWTSRCAQNYRSRLIVLKTRPRRNLANALSYSTEVTGGRQAALGSGVRIQGAKRG